MPRRPAPATPAVSDTDRAAENIRRLAAGFVHEVNNALHPMMSAAFLLEQKADDPAAVLEVARQLGRTADALSRQTRLVSAMLKPNHVEPPHRATPTPAAGTPATDTATSRALQKAPATPLRVLVADDQDGERALLVATLQALGYDVVAQAATGDDACERALTASPDVLLLDVRMPGGSGIDAARRLRTERPDLAIVLCTGDTTLDLAGLGLEASAALAVLPKPAAPNALDASLRLAVHHARELRQAREDAADAKRQLEHRKLIDRAKGLLMQRMNCSEPDAYRFLQKTSQNRAVPIVEIARLIIENPGDVL